MANPSRRLIAGLIRFALVIIAIVLVTGYVRRRLPKHRDLHVATAPAPDSLGPGDLRIYSSDSTIELVLTGDKILAGLSLKMVEQIKAKIDTSTSKDTSGLGASISSMVKRSVAGAIGTHAAFPLAEVRDLRYVNGQITFDWTDGRDRPIFENTNINGTKASKSFREADVQRLIAAVRARKAELGAVSPTIAVPSASR
jgi:hypothetical protein